MFYDIIQIVDEEHGVIYSEQHGSLHMVCSEHFREVRVEEVQHITVSQLGSLLVGTDTEAMVSGSRKSIWIEQLLLNCLQGLRQR